jgi:hypothetical protein
LVEISSLNVFIDGSSASLPNILADDTIANWFSAKIVLLQYRGFVVSYLSVPEANSNGLARILKGPVVTVLRIHRSFGGTALDVIPVTEVMTQIP